MELDTVTDYTKSYHFYNDEIELKYDARNHIYYLVTPLGLLPQLGVTDTCGIINKSDVLVPWAVKMMAQKLLESVPRDGISDFIAPMSYAEFESHVMAAKSAHRDRLTEAANIGHLAHEWIERQINCALAAWHDQVSQLKALEPLPSDPLAANCCLAAVDWMSRHNIRWCHTEHKIYSKRYGYAGTMDGLCLAASCDDPRCCPTSFSDRLSLVDWKTSNALYPEYLLQTAAYAQAYQEEHNVLVADRWLIRLGKQDAAFEVWHIEQQDYQDDLRAFLDAVDLVKDLNVVRTRVKTKEKEARLAARAEKTQAREKALTIKCKGADRYKGVRKPACNGGDPCQTCRETYTVAQQRKGEQ